MRLKEVDSVAYVRFASVYRDFQDISDFSEEIKSLNQESKNTPKRKSESPKVYGICSCSCC